MCGHGLLAESGVRGHASCWSTERGRRSPEAALIQVGCRGHGEAPRGGLNRPGLATFASGAPYSVPRV